MVREALAVVPPTRWAGRIPCCFYCHRQMLPQQRHRPLEARCPGLPSTSTPYPPCSARDTPPTTVKTSEVPPRQAVSLPLGQPCSPGLSTAVGAQGSVCAKPGLRLVGTQGLGQLRGPPRLPSP